ncbi:hypothetical protein B0H19DRAFT_1086223 [Mycena capillaripes]|nr:hypothetical protein B0H19DRAFT_1086223 [Mycena capillaripes]
MPANALVGMPLIKCWARTYLEHMRLLYTEIAQLRRRRRGCKDIWGVNRALGGEADVGVIVRGGGTFPSGLGPTGVRIQTAEGAPRKDLLDIPVGCGVGPVLRSPTIRLTAQHLCSDLNISVEQWGVEALGLICLETKNPVSQSEFTVNCAVVMLSDTHNVTLHDVENAVSAIVASMFWTGHVSPTHRPASLGLQFDPEVGTLQNTLADIPAPPFLLPGYATVTVVVKLARLEITGGLAVSITLILISGPLLRSPRGVQDDMDVPIDGGGILQAIWLYRSHPELERLLEEVENPTEENLRIAWMIRMQLFGVHSGRRTRHSGPVRGIL